MKKQNVFLLTLICFALAFSTSAQDSPLVITAGNIRKLQSVQHIDFKGSWQQAGKIENGWFALNSEGDRIAVINRSGEVVVWNLQGQVLDRYSIPGSDDLPTTVLDLAFRSKHPAIVSVHSEGGAYYVAYRSYETQKGEYFRFSSVDVPLRIWDTGLTWLEMSPVDYTRGRYIQRLSPAVMDGYRINETLTPDQVSELPSGPENDPDSFLRIGRIDPPFAITITQNFLVKRWNLETGEVTATPQLDALPGAGQLTPDGRFFAWRDGESVALHLLDFETNEDRVIAPLQNAYIPFLLLNSSASVIIGVNEDLKSVVVAWDTSTGERIDLGEYRQCTRQPDMVRLSHDNTTLVIGCDSGLDIWRIGH